MLLRSIIFKLYKLNKILPLDVMRNVYESLYKSIMQYGIIVWGGCADNVIKSLLVQQNLAVRIWMNKKEILGSTSLNYKSFKVLSVRDLYKLSAILLVSNTYTLSKVINKRDFLAYDTTVQYTNKEF